MKGMKKKGAMLLCAALAAGMMLPGGPGMPVNAKENGKKTELFSGSDGITFYSLGEDKEDQDKKTLAQIVLSVGDEQETPVFKAGQKTELKINVANKGNVDAKDVSISPVIEKPEDWPFDMSRLNYDKTIGTVAAGSKAEVVWGTDKEELKVREDVTGKSYKLTFHITYNDGDKAYETDKYVFVKTEAKPAEQNKPADPDKGDQGNTVPSTPDTQGGDLSGGGVYNNDISYSGGGSGESPDSTSVPRVIVTGFDTQPTEVKAGSNFKLIIHLKNTSARTAVSNMLFDLQAPAAGTDAAAEAPAFLPASGSSTIYLDSIPAGGTKDISIDLNARADLVKKPYSITMTMHYEDNHATQFEGQSSLAIPVSQDARFEFSEITISPDSAAVGEEVNITCNLYNLGRIKMYNVKAKFEGDGIEGQEQFIGNLDPGATGMIDGIVTATAESYDENNCKLIISYEDDSGNVSTEEKEFTMQISPEEEDFGIDPYMDEEPVNQGSKIPVIALIAAVIVIAGAAAFVIIRKKKNRRLEEEEEFTDEDERFTEDEH